MVQPASRKWRRIMPRSSGRQSSESHDTPDRAERCPWLLLDEEEGRDPCARTRMLQLQRRSFLREARCQSSGNRACSSPAAASTLDCSRPKVKAFTPEAVARSARLPRPARQDAVRRLRLRLRAYHGPPTRRERLVRPAPRPPHPLRSAPAGRRSRPSSRRRRRRRDMAPLLSRRGQEGVGQHLFKQQPQEPHRPSGCHPAGTRRPRHHPVARPGQGRWSRVSSLAR